MRYFQRVNRTYESVSSALVRAAFFLVLFSTPATSQEIALKFSLSSPLLFGTADAVKDSTAPRQSYDAWGARKNFAVATAEVAGINGFVWSYNEFIRGGNFTTISPRSWIENIGHGFEWDDNHFNNNNFAHPYHGSLYYAGARSNGFSYWESAPFAIMGSFLWECGGEIHNMAINDWINTGIGGIAIGEMLYRVTNTIIDNQATGSSRVLRETAVFLLNPLRGLNRLVSGRASKVGPNPPDRSPIGGLSTRLMVGSRTVGEGRLLTNNQTNVFFETDFRYGNPLDSASLRPFDSFWLGLQLNFGEEGKGALGRLNIKGNLYSTDLKRTESVTNRFSIVQNFDYWNNRAFEFGGQSFGARFISGRRLSDDAQLQLSAEPLVILLGAVNSEYAFLAEVPNQEREREYDYGPGAGVRVGGNLTIKGTRVVEAAYWLNWIHTLNGGDGDHLVHIAALRVGVPISGTFGLAADWMLFLRNSFFTDFTNVTQRVPQFRAYAMFNVR